MAYTDDAVMSKLSALNETHDSIATTAQWIMFHRRHAAQTVHLWLKKLKEAPNAKKLNMIYVANEVTQQSKARHKDDFVQAFAPFIADATATAYTGASADIQSKLRRVVDVWRERNIFDPATQAAMEARLDEIDRMRSTSKVGGFGGPIFGAASASASVVPPELVPMVSLQQSISKSATQLKTATTAADAEFDKVMEAESSSPAPAVHAARLTGLLRSLATAESAVEERIKTRSELVTALEKMLAANREALQTEESQLKKLVSRHRLTESKKKEVELSIITGLPSGADDQSPVDRPLNSPVAEPPRPKVEALTPPHVSDHDNESSNMAGQQHNGQGRSVPVFPASQPHGTFPSAPGIEMLSNLASQYQAVPTNGSSKKRKIEVTDDFPDLGNDDGIDSEVAEILRKDSRA